VYGLVLEDESFDNLVKRVRLAVPELLAMSEDLHGNIFLDYTASRHESVAMYG